MEEKPMKKILALVLALVMVLGVASAFAEEGLLKGGAVTEVLTTSLPVMVMLGIGILCRSRRIITREGINALKNVVVNICLPAVLLNAFATTRYTLMDVFVPLLIRQLLASRLGIPEQPFPQRGGRRVGRHGKQAAEQRKSQQESCRFSKCDPCFHRFSPFLLPAYNAPTILVYLCKYIVFGPLCQRILLRQKREASVLRLRLPL